jgi:hypothetical protein
MNRWQKMLEGMQQVSSRVPPSVQNVQNVQNHSEKTRFEQIEHFEQPPGEQRSGSWDAADWRAEYDERAAIYEFDGHQTRAEAERMAWNAVASRWYRECGERTPPNLCAGCGEPISGVAHVLLLPHDERAHSDEGYACIVAYGRRWKSAAADALSSFGIPAPEMDDCEIQRETCSQRNAAIK